MSRKKYTRQEETPETLRFREKRKWQIALRRYVLEKQPCSAYAPYFGLDTENMRKWFALQFREGVSWEDFGTKWQFEHIIPVAWFDFSKEEELKACWGFINLRVDDLTIEKETGKGFSLLAARKYFEELSGQTNYSACASLLKKIEEIEKAEIVSADLQAGFINEKKEYLASLGHYGSYEFELLNSGKSIEEIEKETGFIKNL